MDSAYSIRRTVQPSSDSRDAAAPTFFGMETFNFAEFDTGYPMSVPGSDRRRQYPSATGHGHP